MRKEVLEKVNEKFPLLPGTIRSRDARKLPFFMQNALHISQEKNAQSRAFFAKVKGEK